MADQKHWNKRLLLWYHTNKRDLPWRQTQNPYFIWISEIMLQQTRVETVKGYYHRFLARFPDVQALADAPEEDVLKLWEGLGYYSRARNLQKAAKHIVKEYCGAFPSTSAELLGLPGIGAYTAGAVASIAFGEAVPAIDGNVKRVASRLFGVREDIETPAAQKRIAELLADAIPTDDAGGFNQALMELGATLCSPRAPKCELCPLKADCDARLEGDAESLPVHEKKSPAKSIEVAVCILTIRNRVLLFRRQERLLHKLYVFALLEEETEPSRVAEKLMEDGLNIRFQAELGDAVHIFTHRVWQMALLHYELLEEPDQTWLDDHYAVLADMAQIAELPLPTAMKAAKKAVLQLLA